MIRRGPAADQRRRPEDESDRTQVDRVRGRSWQCGCRRLREVLQLIDVDPSWFEHKVVAELRGRWTDLARAARVAKREATARHKLFLERKRPDGQKWRASMTEGQHELLLARKRQYLARLRAAGEAAFLADRAHQHARCACG